MEGLTGGLRGSLDGSDGLTGGYAPGFGEIPLPDFSRRRRTRGVTFGSEPGRSSSSGASMDSHVDSVELSSGGAVEEMPGGEVRGLRDRAVTPGNLTGNGMSPMNADPWIESDPWRNHVVQNYVAENWSEASSMSQSDGQESDSAWGSWHGSARSWHSWSSGQWSNYSGGERWKNWSWNDGDDNHSNWSWRTESLHDELRDHPAVLDGDAAGQVQGARGADQAVLQRRDSTVTQRNGDAGRVADPASPVAGGKDPMNRPLGEVPSGVPSVAGNQSQQAAAGGKISSTYPPIFYARPGESWELYWRSVTFWIASEGRSLPEEMRGPRLMQQLRERAANIVQHLTVEQVAASNGVELIRQTMEKSPIIKLLDQKRVDQRRKKFMRLSRLPQESIESFINRAEIYRRENQASPAYQVGSQFYVGHLLDAAKLTKRDHALVKAACGGTVEDEDFVTNALIDLADQLEGLPGCAIGKGEPTMDQEDKYLVQKGGVALSSTVIEFFDGKLSFFGRQETQEVFWSSSLSRCSDGHLGG